MILETRAIEPFLKNGFVLGCERTREGVLIDPGDEVDQLLEIAAREHLQIKYILLTHAHLDHITGVAKAKAAFGAPIALHRDDNFLYQAAVQQGQAFGIQVSPQPPVDHFYDPQVPLAFGDYEVHVHHTPGHSPGGVCLQVGAAKHTGRQLFVGDTLFAGSIGRADLPGANLDVLLRSIRRVLFSFPDECEVFPGHGPTTTIGHEKRTNPYLLAVY